MDPQAGTRSADGDAPTYRPMSLVELGAHLAGAVDDALRWRYVAEFLEEFRHEPRLERELEVA